MSQREQQRYHLLKMARGGKATLKEARSVMGVSYRHTKRLKRKLLSEGARGLVHGNRGRPSPRALPPELSRKIIERSHETYAAFNDTHFAEKLNEVEGITVSRDTVRRLRRKNADTTEEETQGKGAFSTKRPEAPSRHNGALGWKPPSVVRRRQCSLLPYGSSR